VKNKKRIENKEFAWYRCSFQEKVENSDAVDVGVWMSQQRVSTLRPSAPPQRGQKRVERGGGGEYKFPGSILVRNIETNSIFLIVAV
jgi:hypothetical protein